MFVFRELYVQRIIKSYNIQWLSLSWFHEVFPKHFWYNPCDHLWYFVCQRACILWTPTSSCFSSMETWRQAIKFLISYPYFLIYAEHQVKSLIQMMFMVRFVWKWKVAVNGWLRRKILASWVWTANLRPFWFFLLSNFNLKKLKQNFITKNGTIINKRYETIFVLLQLGMKQMEKLGEFFRQRYIHESNFVPPNFNRKLVILIFNSRIISKNLNFWCISCRRMRIGNVCHW